MSTWKSLTSDWPNPEHQTMENIDTGVNVSNSGLQADGTYINNLSRAHTRRGYS